MTEVGLSPRLKDQMEKKLLLPGDSSLKFQPGAKPFEVQSYLKNRRGTERNALEYNAVPPSLTPGNNFDYDLRNRNPVQTGQRTADAGLNAENHRRLLLKLQAEKIERKQREDKRRQKTLEKYTKDVEEKQKVDQEMKDRLADEKLRKHREVIETIQKKGEERKAKIVEAEKAYKEIN